MSNDDRRGDLLLYKPEEAAERLNIGRTTVYGLIRTGELRSVKIGGTRRVPAAALTEFVDGLQAAA